MIDYRAHYAGWVMSCADFFAKDLAALTDEQYNNTYGGVTRSPRNIATEVAVLTSGTVKIVQGGDMAMPGDEVMKSTEAELDTPAKAGHAVKLAAVELAKAVKAASDEDLAREITMPWGQAFSAYALAHLTATHIMYHDGQINYVQAINGDAEMHWFGPG